MAHLIMNIVHTCGGFWRGRSSNLIQLGNQTMSTSYESETRYFMYGFETGFPHPKILEIPYFTSPSIAQCYKAMAAHRVSAIPAKFDPS